MSENEMSAAEKYSRHLPSLEMTVTEDGIIFEMGCACGWSDPTAQRQAEKAGREYDRHLEEV